MGEFVARSLLLYGIYSTIERSCYEPGGEALGEGLLRMFVGHLEDAAVLPRDLELHRRRRRGGGVGGVVGARDRHRPRGERDIVARWWLAERLRLGRGAHPPARLPDLQE